MDKLKKEKWQRMPLPFQVFRSYSTNPLEIEQNIMDFASVIFLKVEGLCFVFDIDCNLFVDLFPSMVDFNSELRHWFLQGKSMKLRIYMRGTELLGNVTLFSSILLQTV